MTFEQNPIILELNDVSAGYTDTPIVSGFSTKIHSGTITTIIGGNGAGKSTLLRAVYGLNRHFGGSIVFDGKAIERLPSVDRLKLGIGLVPQGRCNFPLMSVRENLELGAYTLKPKAARDAMDEVISIFPFLGTKLGVLAGNLSGGEQQILETAMVLETHPKLLLLDEPSLGLSPRKSGSGLCNHERFARTWTHRACRRAERRRLPRRLRHRNRHGTRPEIHGSAGATSAARPANSRCLSRRRNVRRSIRRCARCGTCVTTGVLEVVITRRF